MAARFGPPVFQFENSTGVPYAGGTLTFYATSSSTLQDTYTTAALSIANSNPFTLNSAGWPASDIFLQNLPYKVVLKDSSGNVIWTIDPYHPTDFSSVVITKVGSGNPNGSVAGTAGSSGVLATHYHDYTNGVLYFCATTGSASTAVWTAINASSATPVVTAPQGYLSPHGTDIILTGDSVAGSAMYYHPFTGNLIPIYNGSRHIPTTFAALSMTLVASHLASQIYDVFVFSNSGTLTLVTGPAWTTPTAGAGARGTGSSTTELTRLQGYWVNAVAMTGRNGSTTYSIGANLATYVGSIFMDGTNAQLTCHRAWGASRKWGVWNAYNRQPLYLQAGDATASWTYNTATIRASRDQATNSLTVFQGLPEEFYDLTFEQRVHSVSDTNLAIAQNGIGWNSTTATSGRTGTASFLAAGASAASGGNLVARYPQVPSLGINVVTALENALDAASSSMTWFGTEAFMNLSAKWRG